MATKSIRFKPEMARAILDGRKTVTRRVVNPSYRDDESGFMVINKPPYRPWVEKTDLDGDTFDKPRFVSPPYKAGDILWVREKWAPLFQDETSNEVVGYLYKADWPWGKEWYEWYDKTYPDGADYTWTRRWRSSAYMPRKAARIFLRVTDVGVEQLQDITPNGALAEGVVPKNVVDDPYVADQFRHWPEDYMQPLWDSTVECKNKECPVTRRKANIS